MVLLAPAAAFPLRRRELLVRLEVVLLAPAAFPLQRLELRRLEVVLLAAAFQLFLPLRRPELLPAAALWCPSPSRSSARRQSTMSPSR